MGGAVAWVVERTDAPGGALFHVLALMTFRHPRTVDGDGLDLHLQPEYRLGQRRAQIAVRTRPAAGQHLFDGRDDLDAVEPLFSLGVSRARAGLAGARHADGGGGPGLGRPGVADPHQDHLADAAARALVDRAARVRDGDLVLRGAAPDRPAGPHRRLHHRNPGRDAGQPAGVRRGERAQSRPPVDLHGRGLRLPQRGAQYRVLRDRDRQGLRARLDRARALALAGRARRRADVRAARSGCRSSPCCGNRASATSPRRCCRRPRRRAWRITNSSSPIRSFSPP